MKRKLKQDSCRDVFIRGQAGSHHSSLKKRGSRGKAGGLFYDTLRDRAVDLRLSWLHTSPAPLLLSLKGGPNAFCVGFRLYMMEA